MMLRRSSSHLTPNTLLRVGVVALALLALGALSSVRPGSARAAPSPAPPPACVDFVITDITPREVRSTSATIVWRTPDCPSTGSVDYGPTAAYGSRQSPGDLGTSVDHEVSLFNLTPDTTYHYRIVATDASGTRTIQSVDRSNLRTVSATSANPPTVVDININTIDTEATFTFASTEPATAVLRFNALTPGPPWSERTYDPDHDGTPNVDTRFTITIDPLTRSTRYYYQITLTGTGGQYTTDALDFTTSGSAFDHIFYTGECVDGVRLGQCHPVSRLFCDGGTLVTRCDRCGADCAAGATCRDGGACEPDPALTGNAFQCNKDDCYVNNGFRRPAPAGCWVTWPRCSANIVLKVQRDRVCDQWTTCAESQETTDQQTGAKTDICTGLGACTGLGPGGTCNQVLGQGQCSDDPLKFCNLDADCPGASCLLVTNSNQHNLPVTYRTPDQVDRIQNLSGAIVAGLDWGGGNQLIEGQYPWFLAPQWGESAPPAVIPQGDFEYPARSLGQRSKAENIEPFATSNNLEEPAAVVLEDRPKLASASGQNNLNHVLQIQPGHVCSNDPSIVCTRDSQCSTPAPAGACSALAAEAYIQTKAFDAISSSLDYFVTFRLRTEQSGATNRVRAQFYYNLVQSTGTRRDLADITVTDAWQAFRFGPVNGLAGRSAFRFFFLPVADGGTSSAVFVDDFQIVPVLEIRPSEYVFPSCRLYPKEDAEACAFIDENGAKYPGQSGYCLERDPKNPAICIAWWPVDAIRGEENAFGIERTAGFNSGPLYYCLQQRTYVTQPNAYEDGCVDGAGPFFRCSTNACAQRVPNPCEPGYALDPNFRANEPLDSTAPGYLCPRHLPLGDLRNRCAGSGVNDDKCAYRCIKDNQTPTDAPLATIEYTGSEKIVPGAQLIDQCAVVAKTADFGVNKAWAARLQTSSQYRVPSSPADYLPHPPALVQQYTVSGAPDASVERYLIDYPYGPVLPPEGTADPSTWVPIPVRSTCEDPTTTSPLLCPLTKSPGAKAGAPAPYAWTIKSAFVPGLCSTRDAECANGTCDGVTNTCASSGTACATDAGCNLSVTCQYTAPAPTTGRCVDRDGNDTGASCLLNNVCSNNFSVTCTTPGVADPACGGALCVTSSVACNQDYDAATAGNQPIRCEDVGGFRQCNSDMGDAGTRPFRTSSDGHGFCTDLSGNRIAGQTCLRDQDCSSAVAFCREQTVEVARGRFATERRCVDVATGDVSAKSCVTDSDCSSCDLPQRCTTDDDCSVNSCLPPAGSIDQGVCAGSGAPCTTRQGCFNASNACQASGGTCQGGTLSGNACVSDAECFAQTCNNEDRACEVRRARSSGWTVESPGRAIDRLRNLFLEQYGAWYLDTTQTFPHYVPCPGAAICNQLAANGGAPYGFTTLASVLSSWQVPATRCPAVGGQYERPAPAVGDPDYCGLPPEARNARWAGGQTAVTIVRGQQVSLEFNTRADAEQVPLRTIYIDWTGVADGSGIRTYTFPYQPKSDPLNPHVIRYTYQGPSGASPFRPRVLVQDNWGWCNTSTASNPCPTDRTGWPELGVAVTVN